MIPRVELVIRSANVSSDSAVLNPNQNDISENMERCQMTASNRINSYADLKTIDEIYDNNERNFDRLSYTHHSYLSSF